VPNTYKRKRALRLAPSLHLVQPLIFYTVKVKNIK